MAEKLDTSVSYWTEYVMYEGSERELRFPLAVCVSYQQGNRGKHGLLVRAYVACDLEWSALCLNLQGAYRPR
ncbi:hypothetical protein [Haloterrigena sp. H1]|uniref:hypothetical protein n=1 Tax=Haloterrigena sp. H1 TaxID=2552943 RepID=UPI001BB28C65|nr:hypothetical protein [Haloterrigena sp. H1]